MLPKIIQGASHSDLRGVVSFVNDFDLTEVKRFYQIINSNTEVIRGWQGHRKETKWFYCNTGSFLINYVKPDNWFSSSGNEKVAFAILEAKNPCILLIPANFATAIKAIEPNSILTVYSNFTLLESQNDDYRFDLNTWKPKDPK